MAIALVCGACTSTLYTENDNEITIRLGAGGLVNPIADRYAKWRTEGRTLIIDGHVVSADAIEAFSYPGACYTENAVWSPHAYSNLGLYRMADATETAARKLPDPLQRWFRGNIAFYDWIGFAVVDYDQLLGIWPEGACNQKNEHVTIRHGSASKSGMDR
jgi:hypothetical protein